MEQGGLNALHADPSGHTACSALEEMERSREVLWLPRRSLQFPEQSDRRLGKRVSALPARPSKISRAAGALDTLSGRVVEEALRPC